MGWAYIVFGITGIIGIWAIINPRSLYWTLHAWQHRDPEANEPSDTMYGIWRISSAVALLIIVFAGMQLLDVQREQNRVASCREDLQPALQRAFNGSDTTEADMRAFADEHGLTLSVDVRQTPSWSDLPPTTHYSFARDGRQIISISQGTHTGGQARCAT